MAFLVLLDAIAFLMLGAALFMVAGELAAERTVELVHGSKHPFFFSC